MTLKLDWQPENTPDELHLMLNTLGDFFQLTREAGEGLALHFEKAAEPGICEVERRGDSARVKYSTPAQAARAVGALASGLVEDGKSCSEQTPFETLGIMLDCSRNAVMTVDHLKLWLNRLCLLGYNMVMLYTEDTYELPGEPWFGYQRGAYTKDELKAIDEYAAGLGIEVIPCIQTLGHLERILRHKAYAHIKDTKSVIMVGEPATYELIDKMVSHWASTCRTRRIHVGMDETHDLGRGRYLDKNGYRSGFELFNEHLKKVVEICRNHGLEPMIWSDMYFRLGSKINDYYDPATVIPSEVVEKIPARAELIYWDYYHADKNFYLDWIERHRQMGKEPLVASGIWTWNKYWHDQRLTEKNAGACTEACREAKVKHLFYTQWGDNGAFCDHDSAFAGMVYCADKAYGAESPDPVRLEKRFAAACGGSYAAHVRASDIHGGIEVSRLDNKWGFEGLQPDMWDDPLFETRFRTCFQDDPEKMAQAGRGFSQLAEKLAEHKNDRSTGDLLHAFQVAKAFAERYSLTADLLTAYRAKDGNAIREIVERIPQVVSDIRAMEESFREMWLRHNKPEGLETIQARFGMLEARYREMTRRLREYVDGAVSNIAELDCKCPPE